MRIQILILGFKGLRVLSATRQTSRDEYVTHRRQRINDILMTVYCKRKEKLLNFVMQFFSVCAHCYKKYPSNIKNLLCD